MMIEDEYVQQQADAQQDIFSDKKRYCERCGNELTTSDAFLCVDCEAPI